MDKISIDPFYVIGISVRTTNENNQAEKDISGLWDRFMNHHILDSIPNKVDDTVYSIYTAYELDHTKPYTTILGCRVKHLEVIPEGMVGHSICGGNYAEFLAKGDLTKGSVINKWLEIWGMDIRRAFTADFEVYGAKAQNPQDAEVPILIALE